MEDLIEGLKAALTDRYQIERELGHGGMATVYLAEDLKHHRKVAIKVLRPELAAALGPERFIREIEIAAKLTHPHILMLIDSGEAEGFLYYVMPYIEGESLRSRLEREGKLPVEEGIRLTDQVASALSYAHEQGVVHRDIKPENILLAGDQAIVADFGIARAVQVAGGERLTGTGLAIGTPAYMSPEQAMGLAEVDARSDVYALGCVVYEMVSGQVPFEGETPQALLAKHAVDTAPELRRSDPAIPLFVERAVDKALAKDPEERFATPNAFARALMTGTVVARVRRRRPWLRRALAGAAAVVLAAVAGWWLATIASGPTIERLAVLPLTDLTNDPEQEYLLAGVHEALIAELGHLGLSVTARATMASFRNTDKPIREIARELGVDAVIEGSLFRGGDSLEITARLYDRDEQELWTASYDGVLSNVVALYRGFARAIAGEVEVRLSPAAEERLGQTGAVNPVVYEAYLRGMHLLNNASRSEEFDDAIGYFEAAVEQNPADPLAYTGLALGYTTIGHGVSPPDDVWQRARAAAERAIRLDSTLAEGWAALAHIKLYADSDWEGAERAFRRANELNPSLAMNHYHYAWYLALFGRVDEALVEHRRAQELDPLTPLHTVWIPGLYGFSEEPDTRRALAEARHNVEQYPDDATAWNVLAGCAAEAGLFDEALAAGERALALDPEGELGLVYLYVQVGRREDALRIVEKFEALPPSAWNALGLANAYEALGNQDDALRWLDYEPHHAWVAWSVGWGFLEYRDDPRFQAIARRMNLQHVPGERAPRPLPVEARPLAGTEDIP